MKKILLAAALAALPLSALAEEPIGYLPPNEGVVSNFLSLDPGNVVIATVMLNGHGTFTVKCYKDYHGKTADGKPMQIELLPTVPIFRVFNCGKETNTYTFTIMNNDNKKAYVYGLQVLSSQRPH